MKMRPALILFIALITLFPAGVSGQYSAAHLTYPIARDTFNAFKNKLNVSGEIVDYSTLYPQCGVICGCGTLKIKLTVPCKGYPYEYVYVAFTTFDKVTEQSLKKQLRLHLKKIAMSDKSCFWNESPLNYFNTMGMPFYKLSRPFRNVD